MQIHELNLFDGNLDASVYAVVDNGFDTGKISIPTILKPATDGLESANARIDNIITSPAPSEQEIIDAREGSNGKVYASLGDAIRGQANILQNTIDDIVVTHKNLLDGLSATEGHWKRSNPLDITLAAGFNAFAGIPLQAGKTYYYKHIFLYYTVIVYDGTSTVVTLTNDTTQDMSGSFTPQNNGTIYVTANKTFTPMFTDDLALYDSPVEMTYYTPNKLRLSVVQDEEDLISTYGYTDGYYLNGQGQPSSNNDFRVTGFIPVLDDTLYAISWTLQFFIAFYDANKTFISRPIYSSGNIIAKSKIHIPAGAKYVRLSYAISTQQYTKFAKVIEDACFHVGANYPYTKVSDAVIDATKELDQVVIIHDGTYDLYTELGGSGYFDTYDHNVDGEGLVLKNRVHLIGSSNAEITFNYTGNNTEVKQYFSVFNGGVEGFTLENINITCSNCRYAVHDERYTSNDIYSNKYFNCNITIDNSANSYGYRQCIGGGLGTNAQIIIKDCTFKTVGSSVAECVSYHNSSASGAKSRVVVSGNYCDNGTLRFSWHGTSTKITEIIASNNSLPAAIATRAESQGDNVQNITLKEWNNVIRS